MSRNVEPTNEELKKMKLQVRQDMEPEERKKVYALIRRRADLLTAELTAMKEQGKRPTVSYLRQSYNISGKALHLKLQKIFGLDYSCTEASLKKKRESKIIVKTDGNMDVGKTVEKLQLRRNLEECPTLADVKRIKKMGKDKAVGWLTKVASGKLQSDLVTQVQAEEILKMRDEQVSLVSIK